jgi:hypothetical protein
VPSRLRVWRAALPRAGCANWHRLRARKASSAAALAHGCKPAARRAQHAAERRQRSGGPGAGTVRATVQPQRLADAVGCGRAARATNTNTKHFAAATLPAARAARVPAAAPLPARLVSLG